METQEFKDITLTYKDLFKSKGRYGPLIPKNTSHGSNINALIEISNDWILEDKEEFIDYHNDNREDRYHGFKTRYRYKDTDKFIIIDYDTSATGKTLIWTFTLKNMESKEYLFNLLNYNI